MQIFNRGTKSKVSSYALAVLTDHHAGFRGGLLNPDVLLYDETDDGGYEERCPELNARQVYLDKLDLENLHRYKEWVGDTPTCLLYLGDPTHGVKYVTQVSESSIYNQCLIATANLGRWIEATDCKIMRMAAGTDSHEFENSSASAIISRFLRGNHRDLDIKVVQHGLLEHNGLVLDYSHHGPTGGSRVWLYGNAARWSLRSSMLNALLNGEKPPDIYLRGHRHVYMNESQTVYTKDKLYESRMITVPSMCWMTNFARQVTQSLSSITNGIIGIKIIEDGYIVKFFGNTVDIRAKETI